MSICLWKPDTDVGYLSVLVRATIVVMKHYDQSNVERKRFICFMLCITVHHGRKLGQELKQGRNLEAGADIQAVEERSAAY